MLHILIFIAYIAATLAIVAVLNYYFFEIKICYMKAKVARLTKKLVKNQLKNETQQIKKQM